MSFYFCFQCSSIYVCFVCTILYSCSISIHSLVSVLILYNFEIANVRYDIVRTRVCCSLWLIAKEVIYFSNFRSLLKGFLLLFFFLLFAMSFISIYNILYLFLILLKTIFCYCIYVTNLYLFLPKSRKTKHVNVT